MLSTESRTHIYVSSWMHSGPVRVPPAPRSIEGGVWMDWRQSLGRLRSQETRTNTRASPCQVKGTSLGVQLCRELLPWDVRVLPSVLPWEIKLVNDATLSSWSFGFTLLLHISFHCCTPCSCLKVTLRCQVPSDVRKRNKHTGPGWGTWKEAWSHQGFTPAGWITFLQCGGSPKPTASRDRL